MCRSSGTRMQFGVGLNETRERGGAIMAYMFYSSKFMEADFPFYINRFVHAHEGKAIPHMHDFVELVYVVKGEAVHWFEGQFYPIGPEDVFIMNPGEIHMYHVEEGKRLEVINCLFKPGLIRESLLRELDLVQELDFLYVLPFLNEHERFTHSQKLDREVSSSILHLLEQMIQEQRSRKAGHRTLIKMKLVEILVLLSRYSHPSEQISQEWMHDDIRLRRICGYLERHSYEKIHVDNIAGLFHLSPRQLNRVLKERTGYSVMEMVHKFRLEQAKQLLKETDEKVIAISGLVGYDSPQFFNRLFAREIGCSPREYRTKIRKQQHEAEPKEDMQHD